MKVLYAACRNDPMDPDAASGVDYCILNQFRDRNYDLRVVGPFKDEPSKFELLYRKIHRIFSRKLHAKFSVAYLRKSAEAVEKAIKEFQPDLVWTKDLIPLVFLRTKYPIVFRSDALFAGTITQWPTYSKLETMRMLKWEKAGLSKSRILITESEWAKQVAILKYNFSSNQILVTPANASLPKQLTLNDIPRKGISSKHLNLLFVGRDFTRKRLDIALQIVRLMRKANINAVLRVVGNTGEDEEGVRFMGLYGKKDPHQLEDYVNNYRWAHFLIHPAAYEAGGIACSEAAGFGVPTITNATGGLETTVKNGVSGIVLPFNSPAEAYVEILSYYLEHEDEYSKLRESTKARFDAELNWDKTFDRIIEKINEVVLKK